MARALLCLGVAPAQPANAAAAADALRYRVKAQHLTSISW